MPVLDWTTGALHAGRLSRSVMRRNETRRHALARACRVWRWPVNAVASSPTRPAAGWLPRAILSGFIAAMAMVISFFVAWGVARVLANVTLADRRGADAFHQWMVALTSNQVLDL